jgi:hypothetical protein
VASTRILLPLLLISAAAFGQRSGGFGGGFGHSPGPVAQHSASSLPTGLGVTPGTSFGSFRRGPGFGSGFGHRGFRGGIRYRPGFGLYAPYLPLSGYDFYAPYSPLYGGDEYTGENPDQYTAPGNVVILQPEPSAPPEHATAVIHEYKFDSKPVLAPGELLTFTIVLKDGSRRSALASWVQNGKLHYLDSQSRQRLLMPEVIDREATERANEGKNLRMDLPPG